MESGHIFLSYARGDGKQYAERLEHDLTAAGYKTWRDKRNLNEYADFSAEIEMGIRSATCVTVCVTPSIEHNPSSFVRREIIYAQTKRKPIIPLVFPQADVPVLINNLTWIPFFEDGQLRYDSGFQELLKRLRETPKASDLQAAPEDAFRDYLTQLYEWIVTYLDKSVFSLISLGSTVVSDATKSAQEHSPVLPIIFLDSFALAAGIKTGASLSEDKYKNIPEAFKAYQQRVLLLGDPGSGKTTTLMAFARDAIVKRLENPAEPLPLLAPIATWEPYEKPQLAEWLSKSVPSLQEAILEIVHSGRALLLLDGLDELGSERPIDPKKPGGETFDPRQEFIRQIPDQNQILLTCRINDYQAIGEKVSLNGAVRLQPLTDAQISNYLADQPELLKIMQRDEQLKELARTPLLLSLVTFAFSDVADNLVALEGLSRNDMSDRIFEAYLRRRYEHEKRKPFAELPYAYDKMILVLQCVACMDALGEGQNTVQSLYVNQCVGYEPDIFIEQATRLHILVPTISPTIFRFIHLLLRDYFAFPELLDHLGPDYSDWRRQRAASVLGEMQDVRAVAALGRTLLKDVDANVRSSAANALGKIGASEGVSVLVQALEDNYARVRGSAGQALGLIGDGRAVGGLIRLARDGDKVIRQIAIGSISKIRDEQAIPALIDSFSNSNSAISQAASDALAQIGQGSIPDLIVCLDNDQPVMRQWAALTLGKMHAVDAIANLAHLLSDDAPLTFTQSVKDTAAAALELIGTPEALEALEAWRHDI